MATVVPRWARLASDPGGHQLRGITENPHVLLSSACDSLHAASGCGLLPAFEVLPQAGCGGRNTNGLR